MNRTSRVFFVSLFLTTTFCTHSKEPREGFITSSDGLRLYYCLVGSGPDTVVVPAAVYLTQEFKRLAPGRTLIFYDPRNRGRSEAVVDSGNLGLQFELSDLEKVRQYFKLKTMSLIGWSYLGAIVTLYAAEHPEQVDRIIQIGPLPPRRHPYWPQFLSTYSARLDSGGMQHLLAIRQTVQEFATPVAYRKMYRRLRANAMLANPEAFYRFKNDHSDLENEHPDTADYVLSRIHDSLGNWDWREELSNLLMPVLTIQGEQDPLPMAGAEEWVEILLNARLLRIPNSGHLPFVEQPDIFYPAVEQFLNGEWPDGS